MKLLFLGLAVALSAVSCSHPVPEKDRESALQLFSDDYEFHESGIKNIQLIPDQGTPQKFETRQELDSFHGKIYGSVLESHPSSELKWKDWGYLLLSVRDSILKWDVRVTDSGDVAEVVIPQSDHGSGVFYISNVSHIFTEEQ